MRVCVVYFILLVICVSACKKQEDIVPSLSDKLIGNWNAVMAEKHGCTDAQANGISYFMSCPDNPCLQISFFKDNNLSYRQRSETTDYFELSGEFHVADSTLQVCPDWFSPCLDFEVAFEEDVLILTQVDDETGCLTEITFNQK